MRREVDKKNRKENMYTAFIVMLLKIISSPALLAGLIAFLQKLLHP
jgi:hypothetical protein